MPLQSGRILLINYELPPIGAGAGNATANIARCLAAAGADVLVLTSRFGALPRHERRDGYTILRVPVLRRRVDRCSPLEMLTFVAGGVAPLLAVGKRWRPDVACAFFGVPSGPLALLLRAAFGVRYVVSLRGGDVPGFLGREMALMHSIALPLIKAVWWRSEGLIANSPGLADLARRSWAEAPLDLIPNGVDVDRFAPPARARPAEPLRLLCVGRLARQKGVGDLLAALAASSSGAVLRVVGDGPERAALEESAAGLGLSDRVEFVGWVARADLPAQYAWGDVFVLPSIDEGMPNVVLEAMAAGLPVIGTDVAGTRDLVEAERNGFLVPPGSPGSIASAIDRFAASPELVLRLGRGGREDALGRRWEGVAERYLALLRAAASGRAGRRSDPAAARGERITVEVAPRRCPTRLSTA